ncbi:MAG: cysteine desulfurase [Candidatus Wallbacteria bacterium]|nr:cysteine desulfurase [Candidatus Wallbacteria bacterium]
MPAIYLDHNASTPLAPQALEAMMPFLTSKWGNASSIHSFGRALKKAVEDAREKVAALIGAPPRGLLFTSGGTEANNLAILGTARAAKGQRRKIVTSRIEHSSVAAPCKALEKTGFDVVYLPPDVKGCVRTADVEATVDDRTLLVTVMLANNETGALQPLAQIAAIARERGALVHTDAVQCPGKIGVDVRTLGVDLLSLGGHKLNGPHGVGALWMREGLALEKVLHGADHERGLRPGTPNVPGIAGLGAAAGLAMERGPQDAQRLGELSGWLERALLSLLPGCAVNGPPPERRLPNTVNLRIPEVDGESLLLALDLEGIAVSTGSACHSGGVDPSPVLLAMGLSRAEALSSVRISLGHSNTRDELDRFLAALTRLVVAQRAGTAA